MPYAKKGLKLKSLLQRRRGTALAVDEENTEKGSYLLSSSVSLRLPPSPLEKAVFFIKNNSEKNCI